MEITDYSELGITVEDYVAVMEIQRPPHNFFDFELISQLSAACEALGENDACRTRVLCAAGTAFCAGAHVGAVLSVVDWLSTPPGYLSVVGCFCVVESPRPVTDPPQDGAPHSAA